MWYSEWIYDLEAVHTVLNMEVLSWHMVANGAESVDNANNKNSANRVNSVNLGVKLESGCYGLATAGS